MAFSEQVTWHGVLYWICRYEQMKSYRHLIYCSFSRAVRYKSKGFFWQGETGIRREGAFWKLHTIFLLVSSWRTSHSGERRREGHVSSGHVSPVELVLLPHAIGPTQPTQFSLMVCGTLGGTFPTNSMCTPVTPLNSIWNVSGSNTG